MHYRWKTIVAKIILGIFLMNINVNNDIEQKLGWIFKYCFKGEIITIFSMGDLSFYKAVAVQKLLILRICIWIFNSNHWLYSGCIARVKLILKFHDILKLILSESLIKLWITKETVYLVNFGEYMFFHLFNFLIIH